MILQIAFGIVLGKLLVEFLSFAVGAVIYVMKKTEEHDDKA